MISKKRKLLFLHPNKTGGKSIEFAMFDKTPKNGSSDHRTLKMYQRKFGNEINSYFKFMFCRNPWDRLVSIYFAQSQILRKPVEKTFTEFVHRIAGEFDMNFHGHKSAKEQIKWIEDINGQINIDFIGMFENMQKDWNRLCKTLNVSIPLPHFNKSKHKKYQKYYNLETKALVAKLYKKDIEYFGYTFED